MDNMKLAFIKCAINNKVLKFGEFQLKSGRLSPYFFNAGLFYTGDALRQVGRFYAQTLIDRHMEFDHLFGPAYKGLPLATATAIALNEHHHQNITVTFNRKEIKNHGEGGQLIGAPLTGRTIIIDDVMTAGVAFREAQILIKNNGGHLKGVIIALNRCERGLTNKSTLMDIENQGIHAYSIVNFFDLIDYLKSINEAQQVNRMLAYHELYGSE